MSFIIVAKLYMKLASHRGVILSDSVYDWLWKMPGEAITVEELQRQRVMLPASVSYGVE